MQRNSVVTLTDRYDMTVAVYRRRIATTTKGYRIRINCQGKWKILCSDAKPGFNHSHISIFSFKWHEMCTVCPGRVIYSGSTI